MPGTVLGSVDSAMSKKQNLFLFHESYSDPPYEGHRDSQLLNDFLATLSLSEVGQTLSPPKEASSKHTPLQS